MKKANMSFSSSAALITLLLLLPGCKPWDWLKEKIGGQSELSGNGNACPTCPALEGKASVETKGIEGDVLVTIEGKPVMTVQSFEKDFNNLVESNPQLQQIMQIMPDIKEKIFEGLVNQQVVDYYIEKNKLDKTAEYQQQLTELLKGAKQILNETAFTKAVAPTSISDSEVKKYYEQNKSAIPDLIISYGGVNSMGVSFENEADAKTFMEKVKGKSNQFAEIAKEAGLADKFHDFKLINAQSVGVDEAVRNKILTISTFPSIEIVKGKDNKYWVINAVSKEEPKYQPFEKVKDLLKPHVLQEKQNEVKREQLEKLKKEYNVQINKQYLETEKEKQKAERMERLQDALEMQQKTQSEAKAAQPVQAKPRGA